MGVKKLTVKGETVDFAVRKGLQEIGLTPEQVAIEIIQRESDSVFGTREAAIAIIYDEQESNQSIAEKTFHEFRGKFRFRFHEGRAEIQVPACFYDDLHLSDNDDRLEFLKSFCSEYEIEDPNDETLLEIIENFENQYSYVSVKELECHKLNEEGALLHFHVSEDEMRCRGIIFSEGEVTAEEVAQLLGRHGITHGILTNNIQQVLDSGICSYFDLARGKPAVDDRPGQIDKFFQEDEHKQFTKMMEELTIDTRSVKEINIADRHQLLLRIGDIIEGKNGYTLRGKELNKQDLFSASEGIKLGEFVYFSDDETEVYSKKSGHIVWKPDEGFIDVEPVYIVEGNVDFSEGNIIGFVGKVIIKGDIKPKFSVIAEGDIEIHGSVEDATVRSTSGNVMIAGSVIHKMEGTISAKETVYCNIATNANIKAKKVVIDKEAMNSRLEAEEEILAEGTPGAIIGGETIATHLVKINTLGSDRGVPTKVHVGDVSELKKRLRTIHQRMMKYSRSLKETKQVISILESKRESGELNESQKKQYKRTSQELMDFEDNLQFATEEEGKIKAEINDRRRAQLEILKELHREVDIHIFEGYFVPTSKEQYTGFRCKKGTITRYSL